MGLSIEQARHNESFHKHLCASSADNFVDWKITCLFYAALHLIKELAYIRNVDLGNKHETMLREINPINFKRKLIVKNDFYQSYYILFGHSRSARYDGFIDYDKFIISLMPIYADSQKIYSYLKKEVIRLGVKI